MGIIMNQEENGEVFENNNDSYDINDDLNAKLKHYFDGRIVRKDLTKKVKEGANVPVYVLEYLLGKYCSQEEELIEQGLKTVKQILANNYVRSDEAQKVLSKLKEYKTFTIIDQVSVKVNIKKDTYDASFENLEVKNVPISPYYPKQYERLLGGNLWCMVTLEYDFDEADPHQNPIKVKDLMPIQLPHVDLDEILLNRRNFTKEEWIEVILRSCGLEPTKFTTREKWLLLCRLIPLVENNYNLCELGPRSTGKSHIYKEISPNSILVSGGQTTVANLFYNMRTNQIGLVGMWDCVAFDEVAGIKFKDVDGVAIMKDYMNSGSFSRGSSEKTGVASMVFVGNINQSVSSLLKTSTLFDPFPDQIVHDTAFFDRMHCYNPGWEIPKFRPESFTDDFGFITDFLSEFLREMRKRSYSDSIFKYFKLGKDLNQRDTQAVLKTVSGLVKIVFPDEKYDKEDIREILEIALESRRRVKEQLKRIGGMEFFDVNFSYIDLEEEIEEYVTVNESEGDKLIPSTPLKPGHLFTVAPNLNGKLTIYKLETEVMGGSGKFTPNGIGSKKEITESVKIAYEYFKSNGSNISGQITYKDKDFVMQLKDLKGIGKTKNLTLATFVALCSSALGKQLKASTVILGNFSIGGTIDKVDNLADNLQVCHSNGAKTVLLPTSSTVDFATVPPELLSKFNLVFYDSPEDAVIKSLGFN